jgi:hypothetical protein
MTEFALTNKDLQLLRSRGFISSTSGATWYGEDKDAKMWQVAEDDDSNYLFFRKEISDKHWGMLAMLSREQFDILFPIKNYPKVDTGD